ncbi:MAG: hypothetical protein J5715_03880 [Clostridiales bacterium]|nr:hypothetical protein [Clostridiales bacterium]
MTPEDIGDIFQELEDALFAMAIRNMDAHKNWEKAEGFKWTQWQAEQIAGLREYREKVNILTNKGFDKAKKGILQFLKEAYEGSIDDAAGMAVKAGKGDVRPAFFGVNSQKMDILVEEAIKDIDTKRYACINRMNSGYTDFLRKADIFAQSGSMTIPQALDYAMKDFLSAGLNCVEYSNGNRVNIASYAEMALRTSSSEVTRQANGDVRDVLGEHLVVSNVIGMTCPYCQRWQGKVLIDDVYSDGKPDGEHQLVSQAKADHFLHPNCRHQLFMYIEGITKVADLPNDAETKERYRAEQKQRYQERQIRKYKRLRDGAVDPADWQKYDARVKEWTAQHNEYLKEHQSLRKNPKRLAPGYTGNGKPVVIQHGAVSGALNDKTDPFHRFRDKQAENMYEEFKNRKKEGVIANMAKSANVDIDTATKVYKHLFEDLHELADGVGTFPPDYDMAQSMQRLFSCTNVQEHDVIMVLHEAMEYDIMQSQGLPYDVAHEITQKKYNYKEALLKWKEENGYA